MKEYLKKLPGEIQDLIYLASGIAFRNNAPIYLVGGFVRDLILGVKNLDLDIVIEGDGIEFAEALSQKLKLGVTRHRRFGTATVMLKNHLKIDIASSRKEYYPEPAHLPEVTRGTLMDDLMRRDFTINAMAISISQGDFGRFIDFFGGSDDLRDKKVRVLHDLSFIDDPTRALRAIRFEQRYDFRLDVKTLAFLKEAVRLKMLEKVQSQRLRDELILILKEKQPIKHIKRIKELVGFGFIDPALSAPPKTFLFLRSIEKQIEWFKKNYPKHRHLDTWLIYFIGLIGALGINNIKSVCERFVFRKGEEKRILAYKKLKPKFIRELSRDKIKPSRIFGLIEPLSYEVIILIRAKFKHPAIKRHIEDFFEIYNGERLHISGDDLCQLGLVPGPNYQKILRRALNAKINGLVKTKEEELALIKKLVSRR